MEAKELEQPSATAPPCKMSSGECGGPTPVPSHDVGNGWFWRTRAQLFGIPLVCIAFGTDSRGKMRVAKGFIAIGQFAVGGIVFAQFGAGIIGIGQFVFGVAAVGQLALGLLTGIGQIGVGFFAVGQIVAGMYGLGQTGWATYLWSPYRTDMEAVAMFHSVRWFFEQDPSTVRDVIKFGLILSWEWIVSLFK